VMSPHDLDGRQVFPSLTRALRAPINGVITGPPGSGKTFFATQLAEAFSARQPVLLLVASDHLARAIRFDGTRGETFVVDTWRRRLRRGYEKAMGASTVPYREPYWVS